jgi:uridine kinase
MLARRIKRDIKERGRDIDGILDQVRASRLSCTWRGADIARQYLRFVKSSYDNFVQPSSRYADVVGP